MNRALLALSTLLATLAHAQPVFTWTEPDGTEVYTDDPTHAPSAKRTTSGDDLSVIPSWKPFPLPDIDGARWTTEKPECKAALDRVNAHRARLTAEEKALNDLVRAFAPCRRYLDVCYSRRLTRAQWETECQRRPAACDVPVDAQQWKVDGLRAEHEDLLTWLRKMGGWGCLK